MSAYTALRHSRFFVHGAGGSDGSGGETLPPSVYEALRAPSVSGRRYDFSLERQVLRDVAAEEEKSAAETAARLAKEEAAAESKRKREKEEADKVEQMLAITATDADTARAFLQRLEWDVTAAVDDFFNTGGDVAKLEERLAARKAAAESR